MTQATAPALTEETPLLPLLKQYFGFSCFRPLQETIMRDSLAGRDVFALLPTGGGKSLCYQLPALIRPGLTVVVSPLIALMKDQVDSLQSSAVPATFLNSSLDREESRRRLAGLHQGQYKLLYAAPERVMLSGFLEDLKKWRVGLFAVDEAHCISEWGHDFRPEYRDLARLRRLFPSTPMLALTATATQRVREDIVRLLSLREPKIYTASFNRPNLNYRVLAKNKPYGQILALIREHGQESGIIYCQSRQGAERLAERLGQDGVKAKPYHAGLSARDRSRHQDLFLRDDIQVICATIAFGMGVNKPNVRFIIHHDLPKNIEGYYQETGRAGRDGLPGACALLYNSSDVIKQTQFIAEKTDPQEQAIARAQLQQMVHYAESSACRRRTLLDYFGENYGKENCQGCDNCLSPRETFDGTGAAKKFLSCVYRARQKTGFGVGLNHIAMILTGAATEKIRRWGHEQLSTYGIGKEYSRQAWAAIGRELIRLGFLRQTAEKFSVIELTSEGRAALINGTAITLTKPIMAAQESGALSSVEVKPAGRGAKGADSAAPGGRGTWGPGGTDPAAPASKTKRSGAIACDEALFERLRRLRKRLADERDVPAYIIFPDVSLRQMAGAYPKNESEMSQISGVGEKKLREFGAIFLAEIADYLKLG